MKVYSVTDVGQVRQSNQDYIYASSRQIGNLPNLFIVADGMGGHNGGDFASRYAVETFVETVKADTNFNPIKIIRNAIETANRELLKEAKKNEKLRGMGTTVVAATVVGHYAYVANVGDSRLYIAGQKMDQVTRDHSLVGEMLRMGELSKEEARTHPDRNIITRALGTGNDVAIDFFDVKLEKDAKIVLCSDGLYGMVSDEEMYDVLRECGDGSDPSVALMEKANENGGKDNIAVIVVEPFIEEVREC
ncbi:MAG: Stp1/IreP family PP2C-type Ser/Thr phosphatase [Ruminococcus sp.]|jgi:serine/threonine protein phosphatase PrpC